MPVVALIARAEPRPIVWCGKTGRRFAGQLFFDQKQGFEPGQRQPEQRDILFALFVVVRRDRIGFSGVRVPQFEPFFAAQGDLFVEGCVREVGEIENRFTVTFFMDLAQRYRTAFQARISLSAGQRHRRGVTDPFHIVRFCALQGQGERPKVGVLDE